MIWVIIPGSASWWSRAKKKRLEYEKGHRKLLGFSEVGWHLYIQMKCREEVESELNKRTGCSSASVVDHKVVKGLMERISLPMSLRC